jgi:hypothetical protein
MRNFQIYSKCHFDYFIKVPLIISNCEEIDLKISSIEFKDQEKTTNVE